MLQNKYDEMIVIFVDILGSREMETFEEKFKIHQLFHNSVDENQELQNTDIKKGTVYTRKLFSFSDCAYIFYGYKEGVDADRKDFVKLLQTALYNTSLMTLNLLKEGYLIRGGVVRGEAYYDEMSFFGPAVEDAYFIESKKAIYPRIMIDESIGKSLLSFEKKTYEKVYSELNPSYKTIPKRKFIPTIVHKQNNEYYLNFLYMLEETGEVEGISIEKMKDGILASLQKKLMKYDSNNKIKEKLIWMKEYTKNSECCLNKDDRNVVTFTV